jgi:hypothetical protein
VLGNALEGAQCVQRQPAAVDTFLVHPMLHAFFSSGGRP